MNTPALSALAKFVQSLKCPDLEIKTPPFLNSFPSNGEILHSIQFYTDKDPRLPAASTARTNRSSETVGSSLILATRDWLDFIRAAKALRQTMFYRAALLRRRQEQASLRNPRLAVTF
jgi:hypothetical protein